VITKAALRETSKQFLISRVFRIYPSLGLALILYWFINTGSSDFTFNSKVWSFSLLGDFNNTPNQLNGVDWTLRLEILFYFACWLILQLKGSKFTSYWRSNDWWIFVLLLLSLVGTLFLPIFPKFGFVGYVTIFASVFVGGAALALFELNTLGRANAIALYLFSLFIHSVQISEIRPDLFGYGAFSFYGYVCFGLLFSSRNKIVSNSFIVLLSNLTYLTYLFHNWVLEKFYVFFQPQGDDNGYSLKVRILSLVIFMVSMWVIHVIFEQPFIKLGRRFASKEVSRNYH
jgi:peptidoglycan/LPS O-acetylase OafA/YrhL